MKNQRGFSLIELLIVVMIIGIVAAIAIPNLLASRLAANEASAQQSLRTIQGAQATYQLTAGAGNFGSLSDLYAQGLIEAQLGSAQQKSGYDFVSFDAPRTSTEAAAFALGAHPVVSGAALSRTGNIDLCLDSAGVIRSRVSVAQLTSVSDCSDVNYIAATGN